MCYLLYLSTTSDADLALAGTDRFAFVPVPPESEARARLLAHDHRWFVSWMGGCSCGFRHLESPELGFGEPEDWCPEEEEHVDNTHMLYRVIEGLVRAGHAVDCLDVWVDTPLDEVVTLSVSLAEVPEAQFRLFEGHLFRFVAD